MQLFSALPIALLASLAIAQSDSIDASQPTAAVSAANYGDPSAATATDLVNPSIATGPNLGDDSAASATNLGDQSVATATNVGDESAATATNLVDPSVATATNLGDQSAASGAPFANSTVNGQQVWVVKVGSPDGKFVFSPSEIRANAGDFVQFQFYALNHSVASSWYDSPCVPNSKQQGSINAATNAFFTGFMPTTADGSLTYTIPVIDDQPVWFYCTQGKHCQAGMVGVINEPKAGNESIAKYALTAKSAPENVTPTGPPSNNTGNGNLGPAASNATSVQTGQVAQATRTSSAMIWTTSWNLISAATLAWIFL